MRDDISEIMIKLGGSPFVSSKINIGTIRGRIITGTSPCFSICKNTSKTRKVDTKKHIQKQRYIGKVYCATVTNHVMMVERNGSFVWCGNSAAYAMEYHDKEVILAELNPKIAKTWNFLIHATPSDILQLPLLKDGECLNNPEFNNLTTEEKYVIGLFLNPGSSTPKKSPGNFCAWNEKNRKQLSEDVLKVKHYVGNMRATYYIDPPYQNGGKYYQFGNQKFDYNALATWCKERQGQVIVCENSSATWMDFKPLVDIQGQRHKTSEVIWYNEN